MDRASDYGSEGWEFKSLRARHLNFAGCACLKTSSLVHRFSKSFPTFRWHWRAAFEKFGVKPRVARSSFEALMRRVDRGLPRIDLLTDIYNAVSVFHRIPIGGENLSAYSGPARLVLVSGDETFDTRENGETVLQHPEAGEVIWRDDVGVTCRRWNCASACVRAWTKTQRLCCSSLMVSAKTPRTFRGARQTICEQNC